MRIFCSVLGLSQVGDDSPFIRWQTFYFLSYKALAQALVETEISSYASSTSSVPLIFIPFLKHNKKHYPVFGFSFIFSLMFCQFSRVKFHPILMVYKITINPISTMGFLLKTIGLNTRFLKNILNF